jgi:hypothetical protein
VLQFVEHRDRKILARDEALALGVDDQRVGVEAELAGALAGIDRQRRRDIGPVEIGDGADIVEPGHRRADDRLEVRRKVGLVEHARTARCPRQAGGAAHHEDALDPRRAGRSVDGLHVGLGPVDADDDRVRAFDGARQRRRVIDVARDRVQPRLRRQARDGARDGLDRVAARQRLFPDARADAPRGADQRDLHDASRLAHSRRHGRACPGHPRLPLTARLQTRGCPAQGRA